MPESMQGRTAVVFGVANKRSIAWAIAQSLQQAGARLAITYQPAAGAGSERSDCSTTRL